jgi:hypothetical protein
MTDKPETTGGACKFAGTDPVRLALDTLWADLPYLMGRASAEGHDAGQALAQEWRAKIDAAIKEAADGKQS